MDKLQFLVLIICIAYNNYVFIKYAMHLTKLFSVVDLLQ